MKLNMYNYPSISRRFFIGALCCIASATSLSVSTAAQDTQSASNVIMIEPLFEYITAPENIESLQDKSNYLMAHFWDPMDFKSKKAVDQNALNDAFRVYTTPMRWASREIVAKSVDDLQKKLSKNPTLHYQFTRAAEETLFGPRSIIWIDEVYIKFLEGIVKNKKVDATRKARYADQYRRISNTMPESRAPGFDFVKPDGSNGRYFPMSTFTIIEFGYPDCDDCIMARLKMESNVALGRLIDKGLVNVLFIVPEGDYDLAPYMKDFPSKWAVGASDEVDDIYDLRNQPSFYTIGTDGNIISKNISVAQAIDEAINAVGK